MEVTEYRKLYGEVVDADLNSHLRGKSPWNKGQSAKTNDAVRRNAVRMKATKNSQRWKETKGKEVAEKLRRIMNSRKAEYSERMKGHKVSPETREKLRVASAKKYGKTFMKHASKPELIMMVFLERAGIRYEFQALINDRYRVDFLLPDKKIIEVDGFWHTQKSPEKKEFDEFREKRLNDLGYDIFRFVASKDKTDADYKDFVEKICKGTA